MAKEIDIDSHKLMYHPQRVSEWLQDGDCFPVYVEAGLTNRCNHQCMFCALDWMEKGGYDINKEVMLASLKDMASSGVKSIMFAGEGEPLLHKDISEFVQKAKEYGMDISITTNGVLLNKEKAEKILPNLSWIRFSLDAATKESYAKIHGTREEDFSKVIENIRECARIKKEKGLKTTIGVQFLLININVSEVLKAAELIKQIGADNIQIKPYSHHPLSKNDLSVNYSELEWLEKKLKELESDSFKVFFRKSTMHRVQEGADYDCCHGLPFFALTDAKGNVIPCNLFYNNPEFIYGNLNEKLFSEIWKSERRKEIVGKIMQAGCKTCRVGCRLDVINRYLHRIKYPFPHDNFV